VDFRELIKIYAAEFKVKVEMRQIGARQESGKVGGIGSCGRELCCATWLTDFKSVNTAAARYQNLSINQTKLSGQCGRLKCCLNYELDTYLDALQGFPENADILQVAKGTATLIKKDIFKNLMWYVLPQSNKQYPLTIERVRKIRSQNMQNIVPEELEAVEVISSKIKEVEPEFVDVVGHITLRSLEKADKKRRDNRGREQRQSGNNNRQQAPGNKPMPTGNKPIGPIQKAGSQPPQKGATPQQRPAGQRPDGNRPVQKPQGGQQQRPPQASQKPGPQQRDGKPQQQRPQGQGQQRPPRPQGQGGQQRRPQGGDSKEQAKPE
jgi:hypothetical protein